MQSVSGVDDNPRGSSTLALLYIYVGVSRIRIEHPEGSWRIYGSPTNPHEPYKPLGAIEYT